MSLDNLIISNNNILLNNISANSEIQFSSKFTNKLFGITIIDQGLEPSEEIKLRSQNLIMVKLPTRLADLMKLINKANFNCHKYLFCHLGKYIFDEKSSCLKAIDRNILLTGKENALLRSMLNAKDPLSKRELLESIWQQNDIVDSNTVESHIYTLRKKIGNDIIISDCNGYRVK